MDLRQFYNKRRYYAMSIDITVNENIEIVDIVAVPNVQNVNITQQNNVENIEIITQPNVYEVNITRVIGGGAVDSVNGQTGDVVLNAGDVGAYTTGEVDMLLLDKFDNPTGDNTQYLDGTGTPTIFPTIPAAQVNSDWNATSGVAEILNKPTIPSVTGFVPYTGATQNVDLGEYQIKSGQIELDQSPTGTAGVAVTRWNNTLGSTETTLKGGSVVLKNGVDLVARVVNKVTPNTTLTKAAYQAVRVTGAQGQRLAVAFAQANNDNNSADTIGLACETIATNQEGFILTVGQLEDINTTGALQGETWSDGDVLYLSPTTAGRLTNVKPSGATGHIVVIGYVEYSHAIHGKIYVKVMNGWELDELHNVSISSPTNNQILAYTSASQLWENKSVETALGFTPENVANKQTNLTASATNYPTVDAVNTGLGTKQNTLVSGTNIKTINSTTILGSGNIAVEPVITAGTTAQYFRGDKTFQTLDKTAVGLANVDNTSDANKPISTATQTALNLKSNLSTTPRILLNNNPAITTTGTQTVCGTVQIDNLGTAWSIDVNSRMYKAGTTSLANLRVYLNDTPNLSGSPTLLGISSIISAANRYQPLDRTFEYSGGVLRGINASNSVQSDESVTSGQTELALSINLNTATTRYLVFSIERTGTAGDTVECRFNRVVLYPNV